MAELKNYKVFFRYIDENNAEAILDFVLIQDQPNGPKASLLANALLRTWSKSEGWKEYKVSHVGRTTGPALYGDVQRMILADLEQLGNHGDILQ